MGLRAVVHDRDSETFSNSTLTGTLSGGIRVLAQSAAAITAPADTNANALVTVAVPANMLGANGGLRVTVHYTVTNNANAKTLRVKLGGTTLSSIGAASTLVVTHLAFITNRGATNSQLGTATSLVPGVGAGGAAYGTGAVDTTAAQNLVIEVQKAVGTDTITLEGYTIEVIRP